MSGTFGFVWKPATTGKYQISATFMGLLGYGSSFATTFTDVEAPLSTGLHETAQPIVSDYTVTIIEAAIAIIVVVIIAIAIVGALIIRKR